MKAPAAFLCVTMSLLTTAPRAFADNPTPAARRANLISQIKAEASRRNLKTEGPLDIFKIAERNGFVESMDFGLVTMENMGDQATEVGVQVLTNPAQLELIRHGASDRSEIYCDPSITGVKVNQANVDAVKALCFEIGSEGTQPEAGVMQEGKVDLTPLYKATLTLSNERAPTTAISNNDYHQDIYFWELNQRPWDRNIAAREAIEAKLGKINFNSFWPSEKAKVREYNIEFAQMQKDANDFKGTPLLTIRAPGAVTMQKVIADLNEAQSPMGAMRFKLSADVKTSALTGADLLTAQKILDLSSKYRALSDDIDKKQTALEGSGRFPVIKTEADRIKLQNLVTPEMQSNLDGMNTQVGSLVKQGLKNVDQDQSFLKFLIESSEKNEYQHPGQG